MTAESTAANLEISMSLSIRRLDAAGHPVVLAPALGAPETTSSGCCGGAAPAGADACCALDADAKSAGGSGCGCGTASAAPAAKGCC